jgi:hypothetical protein
LFVIAIKSDASVIAVLELNVSIVDDAVGISN